MHKESEAIGRKQTFLLIRYVMILATGALALIEGGTQASPIPVVALILTMVVSNVALGQSPPFSFFEGWVQGPVLVLDTAMISTALLLSRASQEFFLFFFFVLIMAAKVENLVTLAIGAGLIGFASFLMSDPSGGWLTPALLRMPFLFAAGVFFGYVVLPERTGQMSPLTTRKSTHRPQGAAPQRTSSYANIGEL